MSETTQRLRIDKSRPYSTIHGERAPGDPHQSAHFQQDGIHYDGQGLHLDHLISDEKTRALVERRLKRQTKANTGPSDEDAAAEEAAADPAERPSSDDTSFVNLEAWLRGDAKYPWFAITKAVRERFHNNISRQAEMVEFLVEDEKIVPAGEVDPQLAALLKPAN